MQDIRPRAVQYAFIDRLVVPNRLEHELDPVLPGEAVPVFPNMGQGLFLKYIAKQIVNIFEVIIKRISVDPAVIRDLLDRDLVQAFLCHQLFGGFADLKFPFEGHLFFFHDNTSIISHYS